MNVAVGSAGSDQATITGLRGLGGVRQAPRGGAANAA